MRRSTILTLFLGAILLATPVLSSEEPDVDEKDVVILGDGNFTESLKAHKYALVEFYAPWCGHCKSLKPQWAMAASLLKQSDPEVLVAKVDATVEKKTAEGFSIQGFPTIKWFVDGEPSDYQGGRTVQDLVKFVKKKTGPPTYDVKAEKDLSSMAQADEVLLLAYFDKYEGADHEAYENVARKNGDYNFYKTQDKALATKFGITKAPGFALRRAYDGQEAEYIAAEGNAAFAGSGSLDERLNAFINAEKLPAFLEFSQKTSKAIFGSGIKQQIIVVASTDALKPGADLVKTLTEAGTKMRGNIVMVTSKSDSEEAAPILNFFGLKKEVTTPQVVGFSAEDGKKFSFTADSVTAATLTKFGDDLIAGVAPKFFKSAAVPAEPLDDGVTVVVGNTVESIVLDPTKDVLLEVYAPWCGHCKSLAPIYSKLAKRFEKIDSVVIAKMDGTENEYPDIDVKGFPTLIFYPAEKDAKPIPYDGARELLDMTKFIKQQAKVPYELPKKSDKAEGEEADEKHDEL